MESGGPKRVFLDDFTLTVRPTPYALSMVQATEVKDIAEEIVEAYFEQYDWGEFTLYQYMGFTNIEAVSFYDQSYSVIRVKGGIVSFDGSSKSIPTHVEIQNMIQEQLDPSDGGAGLTQALQATADFSFVSETIYDVLWEPTPAPSIAATPPPTVVSSTVAPTMSAPSPGQVQVPKIGAPSSPNDESSSSGLLPTIVGVVAGLLLVASMAVLLVYRQRRRRKAVAWSKNASHLRPQDEEQGISPKNDASGMSEAGSSRLGRLLTAAVGGTLVNNMEQNDATVTPPQSSSEETSDDDFSGFDGGGVSVEPIIIPINTEDYLVEVDTAGDDTDVSADLESGIAELVALQLVKQEQAKLAKAPPDMVVEEGILFVESSASSEDVFSEYNAGGEICVKPILVSGDNDDEEEAEEEFYEATQSNDDQNPCKPAVATVVPPIHHSRQEDNDIVNVEIDNYDLQDEEVDNDVANDDAEDIVASEDQDDGHEEEEAVAAAAVDNDTAHDQHEEDVVVEDFEMELVNTEGRGNDPILFVDCDVHDDKEKHETVSEEIEKEVYAEPDTDLMAIIPSSSDTTSELVQEAEQKSAAAMVVDDQANPDEEHDVDIAEMQVDVEQASDLQASGVEWPEVDRETRSAAHRSPFLDPPLEGAALTINGPYTRWSDVSSNHSRQPSISDDDQHDFQPDESWDFNDNDDDSTDVLEDPFQTPSSLPTNDTKPLLGHVGALGVVKQGASDDTIDSTPTSAVPDTDSDTTCIDPFQTPTTAPLNDDKPLLSRLLRTYKLEKVTTSDSSEKRRRSRSAPPLMRKKLATIDLC